MINSITENSWDDEINELDPKKMYASILLVPPNPNPNPNPQPSQSYICTHTSTFSGHLALLEETAHDFLHPGVALFH